MQITARQGFSFSLVYALFTHCPIFTRKYAYFLKIFCIFIVYGFYELSCEFHYNQYRDLRVRPQHSNYLLCVIRLYRLCSLSLCLSLSFPLFPQIHMAFPHSVIIIDIRMFLLFFGLSFPIMANKMWACVLLEHFHTHTSIMRMQSPHDDDDDDDDLRMVNIINFSKNKQLSLSLGN